MKTILSTLTIALFCLVATSQATDVYAQELKGDVAFLKSDMNGDDDCYSFKLGEVTHSGDATQQISNTEMKALLGVTPVIIAKEGCSAPNTLSPVGMTMTYSNGYIREFSVEEINSFRETPDIAQKMLYTVVSVTFTGISFSDEAGTAHTLKDKVFEVK